ncbi:LIC_20245 family lipoprotein [Leptospira bandrabouensis]|uniref:Uncharacterized protein n=1 Tax=Leptospira bandrabouensis TaxID=2484903 RepID=A0A6H3NMS4_9LEPT|nr:hypothetical protein [Leptospira bandrabouensis]MCG6145194.1 hypothetical protein [Leptospira bandrabouensis]MCG6152230.1 hypothetical protein [Leptospira bandrabouensis]MCG6161465.1 hypothetical protein [Leptospira bandrabouensis]MCG6165058.1 hypothetical protein [Leptospira bandrabouensis]MCW7457782.1 hypothetical protein [Leptospira bandrabouensis]
MGIQKKILFVSISMIGLFFLILLVMGGEDEEEARRKKERSSQALALFGGGSNTPKGTNRLGVRGEDSGSIFDSDYYSAGGMRYEEDGTIANSEAGEIPINPQTGKPYPPEAMQAFEELREQFPDNDLIPKRLTPEEKTKQAEFNQKLARATNSIFSGGNNPSDVTLYYNHVKKQGKDRLEIINYLIETQGGDDPEMDKKFQEILKNIQFQNEQIEKEAANAFEKAGISP